MRSAEPDPATNAGGNPSGPPRTVQEFAQLLRTLRAEAGSPSFRVLAKTTHYSVSTLAAATAGRRLPTEAVLRAFVTACGGDPGRWLEQMRQVSRCAEAVEPAPDPDTELRPAEHAHDDPAASARPRRGSATRRWTLGTVALGLLALGAAIGWFARVGTAPAASLPIGLAAITSTGIPTTAPTAKVADGVDPDAAGCTADWVLVDKAPVMSGGTQIGALELLYSAHCGAGWARLYLYPGQPTMLGQVAVLSGDGREAAFTDPLVHQVDDYTDAIVPGAGGCLRAAAAVYEAGHPVVYSSIPCQAP